MINIWVSSDTSEMLTLNTIEELNCLIELEGEKYCERFAVL
jgi:hypothetical protein